jgi:hypothetical protein
MSLLERGFDAVWAKLFGTCAVGAGSCMAWQTAEFVGVVTLMCLSVLVAFVRFDTRSREPDSSGTSQDVWE